MKTKKYKNGQVYNGEFNKDKKHGRGEQTWPDQRSYEGQFKDDLMHGKGIYKWPDGKIYFGDFLSDIMTGQGILSESKSKCSFGEFENSQLQGKGATFLEDDKQLQIKVGRSWNMGILPNGFKIEINNNNPNIASVVQYINNNVFEWIPKDDIKKYEDQIKSLKQEVSQGKKGMKDDDPRSRSQVESLRNDVNEQNREIREALEVKNQLETGIIEALKKHREVQGELIRKMIENEKKLKAENESLRNGGDGGNQERIRELEDKLQESEKDQMKLKEMVEKLKEMQEKVAKFEEKEKSYHHEIEKLKTAPVVVVSDLEGGKNVDDVILVPSPVPDAGELENREKEVSKKENELLAQEADLNKREEELKKREDDLKRREEEAKVKTPRYNAPGPIESPSGWKDRLKPVERKEVKPIEKKDSMVDFRSVLKNNRQSTDPKTPRVDDRDQNTVLVKSPSFIQSQEARKYAQDRKSSTDSKEVSPREKSPSIPDDK